MEQPLTWEEFKAASKHIGRKRAPGIDGLPGELWKTLWEDVGPALFLLTKKAWEEGRTPKIMGNWIDQNDSKRSKQGSNECWRFETNHIVGK